jgi:hypothetical protein
MPINKDEIKKALDAFEDEKYTDAKEILQKEFKKAKNEFVKDKLELKDDIESEDDDSDTDDDSDKDEDVDDTDDEDVDSDKDDE